MISRYYNFILNEESIRKYFRFLEPLVKDEVFQIILCARNKYMTDEQKKEFTLKSHSSVLKREHIRSNNIEELLRKLKRFNCEHGSYIDSKGLFLPENSFAIYMVHNPRSVIKASGELMKTFGEYFVELNSNNPRKDVLNKITKLNRKFESFIQNKASFKPIIDIDFDLNKKQGLEFIQELVSALVLIKKNYMILETRGGYHLLIKKNSLSQSPCPNPNKTMWDLITKFHKIAKQEGGEVVFNKNDMSPIAGMSCGDFEVKIIVNKKG